MVNICFTAPRYAARLLLVLAGALLLQPFDSACQTTVPRGTDAESQLPAELQAKLDKLQADLTAARAAGDQNAEATTFNRIGEFHFHISNYQTALHDYDQALTLARSASDGIQNAITALNGKGDVYLALEDGKAPEMYEQALDLATASHNDDGAAMALSGLGWLRNKTGQNSEALDLYRRALPLAQSAKDDSLIARLFHRTGIVYYELGKKQRALDYYKKALPIFRRLGDRDREATVLNEIGLIYYSNSNKRLALQYYKETLPIFRQIGDRNGEALSLKLIGRDYGNLGQKQEALKSLNAALDILREIGDRGNEAVTLLDVGAVYSSQGEQQKALDCYIQALPLATAVNDLLLEALIFHNMAHNQKDAQPALAIFYGKQAVKLLQEARSKNQSLSSELKYSFLASKGDYYHELADMLIAQGRLPEAQQILDLLKEQEYSDYVRGETVDKPSPPTQTPAEQQAEDDYQRSTAQIVALGAQWAELKKIKPRSTEQEKQYQQLSEQIRTANKGLDDYYARLYVLFGNNSGVNRQVADVQGNVAALKQTIAKMPDTVALYTMVTSDHYRVIVITTAVPVARDYAISDKDLNKKVAEFQQALRDPAKNPKPLATELYKILIGPVKADLDQAKAETLVWSLDGALRYVPMAALYDGKNYALERYNMVTITPSYIVHLDDKPEMSNLSAAAMGISSKYEDKLPPLPAVEGELSDVVKDTQDERAHGVFPGSILLNNQFTEKAMESELGGQHAVVHIASHFVFKPGDDSQSYLLLAGKDEGGAGYHLSVAEFGDNPKLALDDTDLLTLSACETGMSGNAGNGREVDGLGTTAQLKGAKAVISSLWEVNDASTGELMADFYRRWADGSGRVTKIEALRQAQLDLLLGRVKPRTGGNGRGFGAREQHAPAGYAHPYYWAPFVLMGNWR